MEQCGRVKGGIFAPQERSPHIKPVDLAGKVVNQFFSFKGFTLVVSENLGKVHASKSINPVLVPSCKQFHIEINFMRNKITLRLSKNL